DSREPALGSRHTNIRSLESPAAVASTEAAHRAPTVSAGQVAGCFALFVIAWTLYGTIAGAGKALHGDVAEAYAWGREFRLGYNQHPPLWAWVAGAWFLIFPHQDW